MRTCLSLIRQCVLWLKANEGNSVSDIKPFNFKVFEGEYTSYVESSRGLLNCYIKSDGSDKPYRVKWRTGSFYAVQVLPELLKEHQLCDIMAVFGSLDVIVPEVDR